jgi:ParB/RepB/Spo0J family partition protein
VAKKQTGLRGSLFGEINPYGKRGGDETRLITVSLEAVRPDPEQPRDLLPPHLADLLQSNANISPIEIARQWATLDVRSPRLSELLKLAESIALHGLIQPISLRPLNGPPSSDVEYLIVTGERRYWAHALLAAEGRQIAAGHNQNPTQIEAILVAPDISIRAYQLVENIMREDINAVEKANGLWALRRELSEVNHGSPENLVAWKQVAQTLGISDRYRIYLTSVLELSNEALQIVTTHNLSERAIRPIVQRLQSRPDLQVEALRQLVAWQQERDEEDGDSQVINKSVETLVERLLRREARTPGDSLGPSVNTKKFSSTVRRAWSVLSGLQADDLVLVARDLALDAKFKGTVTELQELHRQIGALLDDVQDYQSER